MFTPSCWWITAATPTPCFVHLHVFAWEVSMAPRAFLLFFAVCQQRRTDPSSLGISFLWRLSATKPPSETASSGEAHQVREGVVTLSARFVSGQRKILSLALTGGRTFLLWAIRNYDGCVWKKLSRSSLPQDFYQVHPAVSAMPDEEADAWSNAARTDEGSVS